MSMLLVNFVPLAGGISEPHPLRASFERAGAEVNWENGQIIVIMESGDELIFTPGSVDATFNSVSMPLVFPVFIVDGVSFMAPNDVVAFIRLSADNNEESEAPELPAEVSSHGLMALDFVKYMSTNLPYRAPFSYREKETALWIVDELLEMGFSSDAIEIQEFSYDDVSWYNPFDFGWELAYEWGQADTVTLREDRISQNVILTIPGQSDSFIIVGAHYDAYISAGANDNASGVALLMESAYRMQNADNYHTLVYVFFGAEELGLWGARYYYDSLSAEERDNIVLMINADGLISGPYLMYSAAMGAGPGFEVHPFVVEAMIAEAFAEIEAYIELLGSFEALLEVMEMDGMGIETPEQLVEILVLGGYGIPPLAVLALWETFPTPVSSQIDSIANSLNMQNDLGLLSMPNGVVVPTDQILFLMEGYTVLYLAGLAFMPETQSTMEFILVRDNGLFGDFLHTADDTFEHIETAMPGMMESNLRAFSLLLEDVLLTQFD